MAKLFLALLLIQVTVLAINAYKTTSPIIYKPNEHANISLPCLRRGYLEEGTVLLWILPNDEVIIPDINNFNMSSPNEGRFSINYETGNLTIGNIVPKDDGVYMCVYKNASIAQISSCTLSVIPDFVPGTWDRYQWNFTIGVIAACVALACVLFMGLVYQFRWKIPTNKKDMQPLNNPDNSIQH